MTYEIWLDGEPAAYVVNLKTHEKALMIQEQLLNDRGLKGTIKKVTAKEVWELAKTKLRAARAARNQEAYRLARIEYDKALAAYNVEVAK